MKKEIKDDFYDYENGCLKNNLNITDAKTLRQAESDFAITRIQEVLKGNYFEATPEYLQELNKYLFGDVYPFAGVYRRVQIYKEERALAYLSVDYASPEDIPSELSKVFERIQETDFLGLKTEEKIDYVTHMISDIWRIHPFREGNTRTVLVFLRQYLKSYGIIFDSELFKYEGNFKYTRDALVASAFEAEDLDVKRNYEYLRVLIGDIIEDSLTSERGVK